MSTRNSDRSLPDPNTEPTITVLRADRILGMSRNAAYAAARDGRLPTVAISPTRVVVVTAEFLERYRLRRVPVPAHQRAPATTVGPAANRPRSVDVPRIARRSFRCDRRGVLRPDPDDRPPLDAA